MNTGSDILNMSNGSLLINGTRLVTVTQLISTTSSVNRNVNFQVSTLSSILFQTQVGLSSLSYEFSTGNAYIGILSSLSANIESLQFSSAQGILVSSVQIQTSSITGLGASFSSLGIYDSGFTYSMTVHDGVLFFTSTPITGAQYLRYEYVTFT
jgi:hypothetical protein